PLKQLAFGPFHRWRDGDLLRSIKTLETINGQPTAEFWKPYDVFDAWVQDVQKLPPEKQVETVAVRLKELNPNFDGKLEHTIARGAVTELRIPNEKVSDITAVRALTELKKLVLVPTYGIKAKLSDLSPLMGMKLTHLDCSGTQVTDLSPVRSLPLTTLTCPGTLVTDLTPLKGTRLSELNIHNNEIVDLAPLSGLP